MKDLPTASLSSQSPAPTVLGTGQSPVAIAIDSAYVYWANVSYSNPFGGSIVKVPIGGGNATTLIANIDPGPIAVDSKYVYWAGSNGATAAGVFRTPK